MNHEDFGKLVQVLRKEHRDESDKIWTQEILSQKTNLPKRTIGRIEDGTLQKLDAAILLKLAEAFELTIMERKEFFFAAVGINDDRVAASRSSAVTILDPLIDTIESIELPVFVNDVYGDIILANRSVIRLLEIPEKLLESARNLPAGYNIMRLLFSPDSNFRDLTGVQWDSSARHNMQFFRGISLRYRLDPYFEYVLSALRGFRMFRKYWEQACFNEDDSSADNVCYDYNHPTHGRLRYLANISTTSTYMGGLYSVIYIPLNLHTTFVFKSIIKEEGCEVVRLASWPEKSPLLP